MSGEECKIFSQVIDEKAGELAGGVDGMVVRLGAGEGVDVPTRNDGEELSGTWWSRGTEAKIGSRTVEVIAVRGRRRGDPWGQRR